MGDHIVVAVTLATRKIVLSQGQLQEIAMLYNVGLHGSDCQCF